MLIAATATLAQRGSGPERAVPSHAEIAKAYGQLPLSFIPNAGQIDPSVRYYAQGSGYGFYFTHHKAVLALQKGHRGEALDLQFLGANPHAQPQAVGRGTGRVSYLTGSGRYSGLPTFRRVVYRDLWPGIDMVFHGGHGRLQYAFRVQPGANVSDIRFAYRGAGGLSVDPSGALRIGTPLGALKDDRPRSFELVDGRRLPLSSSYSLAGGSSGFSVEQHDRSHPLLIDPSLAYSTYLGGSAFEDDDGAIAVDTQGAAYVTGDTFSTDFPTTPGAVDTSNDSHGLNDAFVAKFYPSGSSLVYSTYLGGTADDRSSGITVDSSGAAYVAGDTSSTDFPTTPGAFDTSANGSDDSFVAKLDPTGSSLGYSTYIGGSSFEPAQAIAIDSQGAAYLSGFTGSSDFPTSVGAYDTSFNGVRDAFVAKLDPSGSSLAYSTYLGGSDEDESLDVAVDSAGAAYAAGYAFSSDYPTTAGAFGSSANGSADAFVTKLDPSGSNLAYSTYLGGSSQEFGRSIAVDSAGDAYLAGTTYSSDFSTTPGAFDTSFNGGTLDAFVTKLGTLGSSLSYSTFLGGSSGDEGIGVAIDLAGAAYIGGGTESVDFPTTSGAFDTSENGGNDAFLTRLDPSGAGLAYSTYLGGSANELAFDIAADSSGGAYVTGQTLSTDYPTSAGAFDLTPNGSEDAFVSKLDTASTADNSADEQAPAGGTVSTNTTATPDDPVGTSVTTPNAGEVTIDEGPTNTPDPNGYSLLDQQVQITAPDATAASPLVIRFYLDASALPEGTDSSTVQVFRNGVLLPDCNAGSAANPDPCLAGRTTDSSGDLTLTVRTSHASIWNFGVRAAYNFQGYYPPVSNPPAFNTVDSGSVVELRFSLGGFQGRRIIAAGYPRSHRISCNSAATNLGDDSQTAGFLSYNPRGRRYIYFWRTRRIWVGTCRQFVLRLKDGSSHPANFRFTR